MPLMSKRIKIVRRNSIKKSIRESLKSNALTQDERSSLNELLKKPKLFNGVFGGLLASHAELKGGPIKDAIANIIQKILDDPTWLATIVGIFKTLFV